MKRKLLITELLGTAFVAACAFFMRRLYALSGGELIGILFGAVNGSLWESCKTLLLPYLIWSMLELLAVRLSLRRFAAAKAASLYALGTGWLLLRMGGMSCAVSDALSIAGAFALSFALYFAPVRLEDMFAPALVLLFLFAALYFSLTPFPPHWSVFLDPATGMYGIIPKHFDYGASALSPPLPQ